MKALGPFYAGALSVCDELKEGGLRLVLSHTQRKERVEDGARGA